MVRFYSNIANEKLFISDFTLALVSLAAWALLVIILTDQ